MSLANVARPKVRGEKTTKGIHYVVFREKAGDGSNEWDLVTKFWGTDSPATMADDILTAIKHNPKGLEDAIRVAYVKSAPKVDPPAAK